MSALMIVPIFLLSSFGFAPSQSQEKLKQEVTVTAVEVPVRVLHKGIAVKDLAKEDFEVYENGVRQEITAFEIVSRKISPEKWISAEELKIPPKPRLFILIFNVFDYNQGVEEGIDYFFQNIYQLSDRLIVITENRVLSIGPRGNVNDLVLKLKEALKEYKGISMQNTLEVFRELRDEADRLIGGQGTLFVNLNFGDVTLFLEHYRRAWEAYKIQYLVPELAFYRTLTSKCKTIEGDKWAICFQQRNMFPSLKSSSPVEHNITAWIDGQTEPRGQSEAQTVQAQLRDLERSFDLSSVVSPDALSELFLSADITFHLILLKSFRSLQDQDFELEEVAQDYEDSLTRISRATGGYTAFSNKVPDALKEASVKEDYHYLIVYNPKDSSENKERNIEIRVKKEGTEFISLKRFIPQKQPMIAIADFKSGQQNIEFSLKNYARVKSQGKMHGTIDLKIVIFDDKSEQVFSDARTLDLLKDESDISLYVYSLKSGSYFIIIEAFDRITGGKDVYSGPIKL